MASTSNNNPIGVFAKDLEDYSKGLICYVGGEYNPFLFLQLQNKDSLIKKYINFFKDLFNFDFLFEIFQEQLLRLYHS